MHVKVGGFVPRGLEVKNRACRPVWVADPEDQYGGLASLYRKSIRRVPVGHASGKLG